jgi:hypothetical protein
MTALEVSQGKVETKIDMLLNQIAEESKTRAETATRLEQRDKEQEDIRNQIFKQVDTNKNEIALLKQSNASLTKGLWTAGGTAITSLVAFLISFFTKGAVI